MPSGVGLRISRRIEAEDRASFVHLFHHKILESSHLGALLRNLVGEATLTDARLTGDQDHTAAAVEGVLERRSQYRHFRGAAEQWRASRGYDAHPEIMGSSFGACKFAGIFTRISTSKRCV